MARVHLKPRIIFGHCIDFLTANRIQLPGARRLTDLIRTRLSERKEDLIRLVDTNLSPDMRATLDSISTVARTFNVHPATIYRCINEYRSL